ncbi:MAG: hypothetical protein B7X55_10885 [Rhodobacterales bacterium 34-62-10]|nr:MAG: hypothetical protein B7X55_10885 [Rhodobacterales bacterium 34-62-10]
MRSAYDEVMAAGIKRQHDAQMPVRAKRIQFFDDRLFKAIHAAQTGELPFPQPGGGGPQGNLTLSVRAMPMTSRTRSSGPANRGSLPATSGLAGANSSPARLTRRPSVQ